MKILFLDSPAFAKQDMIDAFEANQITCDLFYHKDYKERHSKEFEEAFAAALTNASYAFVFSLIIPRFFLHAVRTTTSNMSPISMTAH